VIALINGKIAVIQSLIKRFLTNYDGILAKNPSWREQNRDNVLN